MDKCREEFEQYIRDQSAFTADFQIGCNGQYKSDLMHFMFVTWQHQQAKVEELQKRLYGALKETQYALQYVEGDMRGNHEFLQMAMIRTFKALEQVLKGEGQ